MAACVWSDLQGHHDMREHEEKGGHDIQGKASKLFRQGRGEERDDAKPDRVYAKPDGGRKGGAVEVVYHRRHAHGVGRDGGGLKRHSV
jgi:hypothetical protein